MPHNHEGLVERCCMGRRCALRTLQLGGLLRSAPLSHSPSQHVVSLGKSSTLVTINGPVHRSENLRLQMIALLQCSQIALSLNNNTVAHCVKKRRTLHLQSSTHHVGAPCKTTFVAHFSRSTGSRN